MKAINKLFGFVSCFLAIGLSSCGPSKTKIQILMTSDMHGMLVPFDYALDTEVKKSGSVSQVSTIINKYRDKNTLVIDCGDAIQGNYAEIFIDKAKGTIHPMIEALNMIKYDAFVIGNHEFNFTVDYLKTQIKQFNGTVLCGNVVKKQTYEPLANPYKIFTKGGIKIAVVGMVSPLITKWDGDKLVDYIVTDPINETKKVVKTIKDNNLADVIIAAEHFGLRGERAEGTSCRELANACPDIDVILASHEHKAVEKEIVNGVLICQNDSNAKTLMKVDINVEKGFALKGKVKDKNSTQIKVGEYSTDPIIDDYARPFDLAAKENARTEIGTLTGTDPMSKEYLIKSVPSTFLEPTPLVNIINTTHLHVAREQVTDPDVKSKIKVAATAVGNYRANMQPGPIRKCDVSYIYKYANTLYILKMNKAQLVKYLEWSVKFYQKFVPGDLTIAFDPSVVLFDYDMFSGINYKININKDAGERIEDLTWSDGSEITDTEEFYIAVNHYRANTNLLSKGTVYEDGDTLPTLYKSDVKQGQGIREMIVDYIQNELGGSFSASQFKSTNWSVTHTPWDEIKRNQAIERINANPKLIGDMNTIKFTEGDL